MDMSITQIGVILVFFICIIFLRENISVKDKRYVLFIVYFLLLFLITFRSESMVDYMIYVDAFKTHEMNLRYEPSFIIIKKIVSDLNFPIICCFFIYALVSLSVRIWSLRNLGSLAMGGLLVYVSNILIIQDMVAIRAGVAGALAALAIWHKSNGETKKMLLILSMALMFHYTSAIFGLLLFMSTKKDRRLFYISIILISYVLAMNGFFFSSLVFRLSFLERIFPLFDAYLLEMDYLNTTMNIFNLVQILHLSICFLIWYNIKDIKVIHPEVSLFLKFYTLGVCCIPLFAQSFNMAIRLSDLLFSVEIFLLPLAFDVIFRKRYMYYSALVIYSSVFFYFRITDQLYWQGII